MTGRRTRVAVLFGGRSTEHAISCVSAGSVLAALDPARFDVVPIGITRDGRWVVVDGEAARERLSIQDGRLPEVDPTGVTVALAADPTAKGLVVLDGARAVAELAGVDVVFPLLHGPYGEDGTVQGLLELAGVPYVGSGVLASALAMDKHHMKQVLASAGLPVTPYAVVRVGEHLDPAALDALGVPVFVKPARGGSSIGISKAATVESLDAALAEAFRHDPKALVEQAVVGREIECGVLAGEDGSPVASQPAEIRLAAGREFYDFEAKYLEHATTFDIPPALPDEVIADIRALAVEAFRALDCEGLARVDFFLSGDQLVVNEVNTMPGFTPTSMFPRMWAATGVDYATLVARLVDDAVRRGSGLR